MSVTANEPTGGNQQGQPNEAAPENNEHGDNPKWQPFLEKIPEGLRDIVKPTLTEWDQNVNQRFQELHSQYEPYKKYDDFVKNGVDPALLSQALTLMNALNEDPNKVVADAIAAFDLGYVPADGNNEDEVDPYSSIEDDEILNHPLVKKMNQTLEQLTGRFQQDDAKEQEAKALEEFNKTLDNLKEAHGDFDRDYVTALMANGVEGEQAVKRYQDIVNQAAGQLANVQPNQNSQQPPIVLGGDGTSGSGIPDNSVNLGSMPKGQLNDLVKQILSNQNNA